MYRQRQQSEELPRDLVLSIQRILDLNASPETDTLDTVGDGFSATDVINGYFPDGASKCCTQGLANIYQTHHFGFVEESLGQLDLVQAQLAKDEQDLQNEIAQLQEELRLQQDPGRMQLIQEMISVCLEAWICRMYIRLIFVVHQDLLGQMSLIREKATESEAIVRNITRDIQVLDYAKKNLILSMTTLKRLQMLGMLLPLLLVNLRDYNHIQPRQSMPCLSSRTTSGIRNTPI